MSYFNRRIALLISVSSATGLIVRPSLSSSCKAHRTAVENGILIENSPNEKGLGAFTTKHISFGTYLGEYLGEVMTPDEVAARFWGKRTPDKNDENWAEERRHRGQGMTGHYLLEMNKGYFIDGEDADLASWTRFMNHAKEGSHECNVKLFPQVEEQGEPLEFPRFFAIRNIEEGEELLWDYGPVCYFEESMRS